MAGTVLLARLTKIKEGIYSATFKGQINENSEEIDKDDMGLCST